MSKDFLKLIEKIKLNSYLPLTSNSYFYFYDENMNETVMNEARKNLEEFLKNNPMKKLFEMH